MVYSNQKVLYDALYHAASRTLNELSADKKYLLVETAGDKYPAVMTRNLNICCRVGNGCELSFAGFEEQLKGVVVVAG